MGSWKDYHLERAIQNDWMSFFQDCRLQLVASKIIQGGVFLLLRKHVIYWLLLICEEHFKRNGKKCSRTTTEKTYMSPTPSLIIAWNQLLKVYFYGQGIKRKLELDHNMCWGEHGYFDRGLHSLSAFLVLKWSALTNYFSISGCVMHV